MCYDVTFSYVYMIRHAIELFCFQFVNFFQSDCEHGKTLNDLFSVEWKIGTKTCAVMYVGKYEHFRHY